MPEAMAMLPYTIVATQTVAVAVQAIDQNGCVVAPTYPIGNKPGSYNNNVFLWKSDINPPQMLPWFTAAFASAAMVDGIPTATVTGPNGTLPAQPYVLGYSVGPSLTTPPAGSTAYPNVCATIMISQNFKDFVAYQPSVGVNGLSTYSAAISFSLPQGIMPSTTGAWVGIWMNVTPPYTPMGAPQGFAQVNTPNSSGQVTVTIANGLSAGVTYTAALFTSGYAANPSNLTTTALAATVSFLVGQPPLG